MGKILDYLPHKLMQNSGFRAVVEWQIAVIEAYAKYIVFIETRLTHENVKNHRRLYDLKELEFATGGIKKKDLESFYEFSRYELHKLYKKDIKAYIYASHVMYLGLGHFHDLDKLKSEKNNVVQSKLFNSVEIIKKDKRRLLKKLYKVKPVYKNTGEFPWRKLILKKEYDYLTKELKL